MCHWINFRINFTVGEKPKNWNRGHTLSTRMSFIWISVMLTDPLPMMRLNDIVINIVFWWQFLFDHALTHLISENVGQKLCMRMKITNLEQFYVWWVPNLDIFGLLLQFPVKWMFVTFSTVVVLIPLMVQVLVYHRFLFTADHTHVTGCPIVSTSWNWLKKT